MSSEDRYILKPLADDGTRGYRLEIDEFMADNDMVNLFILALRDMHKDGLKEIGSPGSGKPDYLKYYALSAIHGEPRESWDVFPQPKDVTDLDYGFCHHSLNTFPTWHRPYMMLYESAIEHNMQRIATSYSDQQYKDRYQKAASRFRLPYWDPIMPRHELEAGADLETVWGLPKLFGKPQVYVRLPNSPEELKPVDNPMYSYSFPDDKEWAAKRDTPRPVLSMDGYNRKHTVRRPNGNNESNVDALDIAIRRQTNQRASTFWRLLSPGWTETNKQGVKVAVNELRGWASFANDRISSENIGGSKLPTESLEMWHNGVHNLVGTSAVKGGPSGQMGNPAVAGFDPIFWMHHNNIDRMLSLYQALYGKNVENPNELQRKLYPFKKDAQNNTFTSADDMVKSFWSPGFAVPGNKSMDRATSKAIVEKYITDTYYWATMYAADKDRKVLPQWPKKLDNSEALTGKVAPDEGRAEVEMTAVTFSDDASHKPLLAERSITVEPAAELAVQETPILTSQILQLASSITQESAADNKVQKLWNAHIRVRKYGLNGSFNIHVFIGWVKDEQPERFLSKRNEVGFAGVFASDISRANNSEGGGCANCQRNVTNDVMVEDVIPLTVTLQDYLTSNPRSGDLLRDGEKKTIEDLSPEEVVPFLKEHLAWRMTNLSSELIEGQEQEAKLEVVVSYQTYTPPTELNLMGSYGPPTVYEEITRGQPGGFGYVYPNAAQ